MSGVDARPPALYVIGGGPLGMRSLRVARELGLNLIVTDRREDAPGFALADETHVVDGSDVDAHAEIARATGARIVGVLCGAEFGARSVDAVRRVAGLPTNGDEAVRRVLDKEHMKLAFLQHGVPTPLGAVAETAGELLELLELSDRVVVKPLGGSGSRGVRVVERGENVRVVLEASLASVAGERAVLVEPYVAGRSIDANGILRAGRMHPAGLLEKFNTPLPARLPLGGHDPARLDPDQARKAYRLLADAAAAVGLREGPVKGDLLLGSGGFTVLEVAPRFHGDVTTAGTLPFGTGVDPVRAYLEDCLHGEVRSGLTSPGPARHALWRVLALPPGEVVRLPDDEQLERLHADLPGLGLVWHRVREGDVLRPYEDTTRIPGYVTAHGDTPEEAEAVLCEYFARAGYAFRPDPAYAGWYARLVDELVALGFDPAACGVPV